MADSPIYLDNHSTTRVDPRVVEAMLPYFSTVYGNAGSVSHDFGGEAKQAVDQARVSLASALAAELSEIVFTSGATESNNLAIRGVVQRHRHAAQRSGGIASRGRIVSVATEHKAVLDPLRRLAREGYEVILLPVAQAGSPRAGWLDPEQVAEAIDDNTILVSVMLANNEIGVIQPLAQIGRICKQRGVLFHTDATQAVGRIAVDVQQLQVDLLSFSAHKFYGPKGVGGLYVRRRHPRVRLDPLIEGGGQEHGLRSGTQNVPGIVGMARALEICLAEMSTETERLRELRSRLYGQLSSRIEKMTLNGPALQEESLRLPGNLNCSFAYVDGEALMMNLGQIAVSSGSACTSANPQPSHVLSALGLGDDAVRASLRFGIGRFNTAAEIDLAAERLAEAVTRLRKLSSLA
jgi:cysteine desulfurase